jgi:hypothetical protein
MRKTLLAVLLLSALSLAQSPPKKKASDFISGECEIGTLYDTKGDCITNPTPAQKKTYGYIRDAETRRFWAKDELYRRGMKETDCAIALTLQGVPDAQLPSRCAQWKRERNDCLLKPNATFEKCERKF